MVIASQLAHTHCCHASVVSGILIARRITGWCALGLKINKKMLSNAVQNGTAIAILSIRKRKQI